MTNKEKLAFIIDMKPNQNGVYEGNFFIPESGEEFKRLNGSIELGNKTRARHLLTGSMIGGGLGGGIGAVFDHRRKAKTGKESYRARLSGTIGGAAIGGALGANHNTIKKRLSSLLRSGR